MRLSITNLQQSIFETSRGLVDFCEEMQHYENTFFILPEFSTFYYQEKVRYIEKTFVKELMHKVEETPLSSYKNHS
jgi:phosphopantetheine adenylyltransferase